MILFIYFIIKKLEYNSILIKILKNDQLSLAIKILLKLKFFLLLNTYSIRLFCIFI